jgi:SAM-dependent methyltransferase
MDPELAVANPAAGAEVFERASEYDAMLTRGIRLSGEGKQFFIEGRLSDLGSQLPGGFRPNRILDFGCGTGDTTAALGRRFPWAQIVGVDAADSALDIARRAHGSERVTFRDVATLGSGGGFDLCYVNGVFHHIDPTDRLAAAVSIRDALAPGGLLALFENNPWNPGTRIVMKRIPFDRDAQPLSVVELRRLLRAAGFVARHQGRFLFYFPKPLSALRSLERWLVRIPFGAQYWILAAKPTAPLD